MRKNWLRAMGSSRRRLVGLGAVTMTLASVAGGVAVMDSAHAGSPCETGTAVGEHCHYLSITTAGPKYEAWMDIVDLDGMDLKVYSWHERSPSYTTWWWRYESGNLAPNDPVNFQLKLKIQSLDSPRIGWEGYIPAHQDACFNWDTDANGQPKLSEVSCAANEGPASAGTGVVVPGDVVVGGDPGVGPENP